MSTRVRIPVNWLTAIGCSVLLLPFMRMAAMPEPSHPLANAPYDDAPKISNAHIESPVAPNALHPDPLLQAGGQ